LQHQRSGLQAVVSCSLRERRLRAEHAATFAKGGERKFAASCANVVYADIADVAVRVVNDRFTSVSDT